MIINYQNLINLPVITKSGQLLGKISKIEIDTDTQSIINYFIKSTNIVKGLLEGELIINKNQVIVITQEKVIVEDNVYKKRVEDSLSLFKTTPVKSREG